MGAPVPGAQVSTNDSNQVFVAIAAMSMSSSAAGMGALRLQFSGNGAAARRGIAPDRTAGEDLVDEALLDVVGDLPEYSCFASWPG